MNYSNKVKKYKLTLQNTSPLIIGTGDEGIESLQIQNNRGKIPATTIAGLFRHFLLSTNDEEVYQAVYLENIDGSKSKNQKSFYRNQSMVSIEDSYSELIDCTKDIGKRTNIKINAEFGTADDKKLFETFYIQPGRTFELELELRKLWRDHPNSKLKATTSNNKLKDDEKDERILDRLDKYINEFIEHIHLGKIAIGSNGNKGFGRFEVIKIGSSDYDLTKRQEAKLYLDRNPIKLTTYTSDKTLSNLIKDGFKLSFECNHGMIIKDMTSVEQLENNGRTTQKTIQLSYKENNEYKIPASTMKGFFRGNCEKLCLTLGIETKELLAQMFGDEDQKGLIQFEDVVLKDAKELNKSRIMIDRFTGGAIKGALINEKLVYWNEPVEWNIDLGNIHKNQMKMVKSLLIWTFRDLAIGRLRLGSSGSVGYGILNNLKIEELNISKEGETE